MGLGSCKWYTKWIVDSRYTPGHICLLQGTGTNYYESEGCLHLYAAMHIDLDLRRQNCKVPRFKLVQLYTINGHSFGTSPDCVQDEWPGNPIRRPKLDHMYPPNLLATSMPHETDFSISTDVKRHGKRMPRGRLVLKCVCASKKVTMICWPDRADSDEQILKSLIKQYETKHGACAPQATTINVTNCNSPST